jgi:hypothetical protein
LPPAHRRWIQAWIGGAAIGVCNGALREGTYSRRLPPAAAHQASTATALLAFGAYFGLLQRMWPLSSRAEAMHVGAAWLGLTIGFEFGFGRLVAKQSWERLLADYDVSAGRTWPLVLAWLAAGPEVTRRLAV